MLKGLEWFGKTIAAGLIISFLSIWTTGYIVNSYVESLLRQYNVPMEVQPLALSGVWGRLWGADSSKAIETAAKGGTANGSKEQQSGTLDAEEMDGSSKPLSGIGAGEGTEANSGPVPSNSSGLEGKSDDNGIETALTTEQLTGIKEEMSSEDKDQLFGLLMSKLPQQSWQNISEYLENGLTEQELTSIQQIVAQHLDKDEYEQMMLILKKY